MSQLARHPSCSLGLFALLAAMPCTPHLRAQWQIQTTGTTADLRGIDYVGNGVAWASGSAGTVLRTVDLGKTWQHCTVPAGGEALDFRGVQASDRETAVVMSSGKGSLSRLYRTADGCRTWKMVFTDPDETGFFDALHRVTNTQFFLLGDPVESKFAMFTSRDGGSTWYIADDPGLDAPAGVSAFAASNSAFASFGTNLFFGTGGTSALIYRLSPKCNGGTGVCALAWEAGPTPLAKGIGSAGVFSMAGHLSSSASGRMSQFLVAVGGTYTAPDAVSGTAALSSDGGKTWSQPQSMPRGYRSAVAYDAHTNTWITVGPNGTDLSTDDGRNWHALKPSPQAGNTPDADQHWNAVSLPFVVGPHGRIGLRDGTPAQP